MAGVVRMITDGLRNLASGLGVSGQDKTESAQFILRGIDRLEIDAVYRGTWLGRKIHDIPAKDMTREWRGWQAEDDQIEAIENEEKRLQLRSRIRKALILSRLYGGSAIIMGLPGNPSEPAPPTIGKGALRYLHVAHRYHLSLDDPIRDPQDPLFGQPTAFRLTTDFGDASNVAIHPSRVITFLGNTLPDETMGAESWYWGDPLLMAVRSAIVSHDTTTASITALIQEAKTDVVHIPGLMDSLSNADYERTLMERLNLAALIKSITNTLILDGGDGSDGAGEKWETRELNLAGLPDIQRAMFQLVAGAADIPATRLIGQAPVGMNATGDSDTRNYYDMLSSEQESEITPTMSPLDEYLIMSAIGSRDPSIYYEWHPLWQMTPDEKAKRDKAVAETAQIYGNMGVVPADALAASVQNRLIEDAVFPGLEAAIAEAELEADILTPAPEITPLALPQPANDPNAPEQITGNSRRRAANDRARRRIRSTAMRDSAALADATPRPLYVSRKVINGRDLVRWAEAQGFKAVIEADKLHVTIAASREPVDWLKVGGDGGWSGGDGELKIAPGGPRVVEPLGDAVVLLFNSWELKYRNEAMREAGASWDFADYQPHISISYDREANADLDLMAVEPYIGPIILGPEVFEEFEADAIAEA